MRILNTSDQTQALGAQTVVAVAKAVTSVAELELPHVDSESTTSEIHRYHPEEEYEETLSERTVGAECRTVDEGGKPCSC